MSTKDMISIWIDQVLAVIYDQPTSFILLYSGPIVRHRS